PTTTLDDFVRFERLERLDLVKIDIQGAEPLMLEGGSWTLTNYRPDLLMEISPADLKGCGKNSIDLVRQVQVLGYEVFELRRSGKIGSRVTAHEIASDYYKNAVLCRRKAG